MKHRTNAQFLMVPVSVPCRYIDPCLPTVGPCACTLYNIVCPDASASTLPPHGGVVFELALLGEPLAVGFQDMSRLSSSASLLSSMVGLCRRFSCSVWDAAFLDYYTEAAICDFGKKSAFQNPAFEAVEDRIAPHVSTLGRGVHNPPFRPSWSQRGGSCPNLPLSLEPFRITWRLSDTALLCYRMIITPTSVDG